MAGLSPGAVSNYVDASQGIVRNRLAEKDQLKDSITGAARNIGGAIGASQRDKKSRAAIEQAFIQIGTSPEEAAQLSQGDPRTIAQVFAARVQERQQRQSQDFQTQEGEKSRMFQQGEGDLDRSAAMGRQLSSQEFETKLRGTPTFGQQHDIDEQTRMEGAVKSAAARRPQPGPIMPGAMGFSPTPVLGAPPLREEMMRRLMEEQGLGSPADLPEPPDPLDTEHRRAQIDNLKSMTAGRGQTDDPIDDADPYTSDLRPSEVAAFDEWKKSLAPDDSGIDYDFRGAFKSGIKPDKSGHWPDTFKMPNHPTFSNESKYAVGAAESKAGHWQDGKFVPPKSRSAAAAGKPDTSPGSEKWYLGKEYTSLLEQKLKIVEALANTFTDTQRKQVQRDLEAINAEIAKFKGGGAAPSGAGGPSAEELEALDAEGKRWDPDTGRIVPK